MIHGVISKITVMRTLPTLKALDESELTASPYIDEYEYEEELNG